MVCIHSLDFIYEINFRFKDPRLKKQRKRTSKKILLATRHHTSLSNFFLFIHILISRCIIIIVISHQKERQKENVFLFFIFFIAREDYMHISSVLHLYKNIKMFIIIHIHFRLLFTKKKSFNNKFY